MNNLGNITFEIGQVTKTGTAGLSKKDFIPLADVPDLVWKIGPYNRGEPERPNHFADMDRKLNPPLPEGATLLAMCDDPSNIDPDVWHQSNPARLSADGPGAAASAVREVRVKNQRSLYTAKG